MPSKHRNHGPGVFISASQDGQASGWIHRAFRPSRSTFASCSLRVGRLPPRLLDLGKQTARTARDDDDEPADLPPPGWYSMVSRSTGDTYYVNEHTEESQHEFPSGPAPRAPL